LAARIRDGKDVERSGAAEPGVLRFPAGEILERPAARRGLPARSAELEGSDGQLSPRELVDLARESLVLGLPAGAFVQHAWRSLESGYDVANIRGAEAALTVWLALGDPTGVANLRTRLTAMHAEVLWRAAPGIPIPDLMSAATGATIEGRSPSLATAVNQTFLDQHGYWLLPTTVPQNNVVEPMTLYFGLWLTGANVDGGGVIL
jgi:hypothetical protein